MTGNGWKIIKMGLSSDSRKILKHIHQYFKKDKSFSLFRALKMIRFFVKGEKIVEHQGQYVISTFMPPFPSAATITHAKSVMNPQQPFLDQAYSRRTAPISMYLCITDHCPYNCLHCSASGREKKPELTTQQWKEVIGGLQDMGTSIIGITGGEPLVRRDIVEIVKSIDKRSSSILFTTGEGLTLEKARQLKAAGLFALGISLDSEDREAHDQRRRHPGAFEVAKKAFSIGREAGLYTMAQTVILQKDVDQERLFSFFRFAKSLGAHEVKILEPLKSGKFLTKESMKDVFFSEETRKKLIAIHQKTLNRRDMPKVSCFPYTEHPDKYGCGAGNQHSYLSASGDLFPCDFVPLSFGNVLETPVSSLWLEMNQAIGNPKLCCFANSRNTELLDRENVVLPLNREDSLAFVSQRQSSQFPGFFRMMQKSIGSAKSDS